MPNFDPADFMTHVVSTTYVPSYARKHIVESLRSKSIVFIDQIRNKFFPIFYYGPKRKIVIQVPFVNNVLSRYPDVDVNLFVLSGILSRSVYKYADIYGFDVLDQYFGDFFDCYFTSTFTEIFSHFTSTSYIARDLANYIGPSYFGRLKPIMEFYFRSGRFNRLLMRKYIEEMISSIVSYMKEDLSLPDIAVKDIETKLRTRFANLSMFYSLLFQEKYLRFKTIKRSFGKCFGINFDFAPMIVYTPGMEFKLPIEILARVLEVYSYSQLLRDFSAFSKFFVKVL